MKKLMKNTLVLFALMVAIFCTCSDDSGSGNNQPDYNMTGTYTFNNTGGSCTWSFTADGNYKATCYGVVGTLNGTWSSSGNDVTISYGVGSVSGKEVFTVQESGNQLTLTLKDNKAPVSNVLSSFKVVAKSVTMTKTSSSGNSGGGNTEVTLSSISELKTYLSEQPNNEKDNPYIIKLKVNDLGGDSSTDGSVGYILSNSYKYVSLDLSGSTITSIEDGAFSYCGLTSVIIPNSVTSIGNEAFSYCGRLTSITIPASVTSIGDEAFYCSALTSVTIGNGVKSIGNEAFSNCGSLTSITIPDSVTSIGDGAFLNSFLGSGGVNIGNGVTSIGSGAFSYTFLASVTIPNSVNFIGKGAFSYTYLSEVTFATGSNISIIEDDAFPEGSRTGQGFVGGNTLRNAYTTGKAGTYKRDINGSNNWTKQP